MKFKNGMSQTRIRRIYDGMKKRCNSDNPKQATYKSYRQRGVKCLWDSFDEFLNDMLSSYEGHVELFGEKETTLDRMNNDGDYCKENCRWATYKEQANNRRINRFVNVKGNRVPIKERERQLGLSNGAIQARIRLGWSEEKAIMTPKVK